MTPEEFFERLDNHNDEDEVRQRIAAGNYNETHKKLAEEWLRRREVSRSDEKSSREEEREVEKLEIARQALTNSKRATRIAILALAISLVMALNEVLG